MVASCSKDKTWIWLETKFIALGRLNGTVLQDYCSKIKELVSDTV